MSNKTLHILIISSWFPNKNNPTDGTFVFEQAKALQEKGHKVHVLKPNLSGTSKQYWNGKSSFKPGTHKYEYNGINVTEIVQPVPIPGLGQMNISFLFAKAIGYVKQYMNKYGKPDIIHSHAILCGGLLGSSLSSAFKIPQIHTEHSSKLITADSLPYKSINTFFYNQVRKVLFVSKFLKENATRKHNFNPDKSAVLGNLVANTFFKEQAYGVPGRFVFVGNNLDVKNPTFLFDIWRDWHTKHPDSSLHIIGSGYENTSWKNEAESLNIKFLGRLNREEILDEMKFARCILSTSKVETFGLSLAEGLAINKMVIVTDCGGPKDFIIDTCGFIIEQGNKENYLNAMEVVYQSDYYKTSDIREYARSIFSEDIIISKLEREYNKLV